LRRKTRELRAEKLLISTGRQPNSDKIAIEKAGVAVGKHGQVLVDEFLRTNVPHIFAAGDVIGREVRSQMATPVGSQDGGIAVHNAFSNGQQRRVNHRVIPRTIFTDPQIAVVGMTEEEARGAGHPCWCNVHWDRRMFRKRKTLPQPALCSTESPLHETFQTPSQPRPAPE
jgi:mercuric reductase